MSMFSVLLLTAAPAGLTADGGGAFVKIDGREALLRSVELFLKRDSIKQIQLIVAADAIEEAKRKYGAHLGFSGVKMVVGGPRWMQQICAGAEKLDPDATHVIVHDAARPIVPYSDLDVLMEQAARHDAVALYTPLRNTLLEVDEGNNPLASHLPGRFVNLLTPQAFSRTKLLEIAASQQEIHPSQLTLVKGSSLNIRIGAGKDAAMAKVMLQMMPKPKVKAPSSPFEEAQW